MTRVFTFILLFSIVSIGSASPGLILRDGWDSTLESTRLLLTSFGLSEEQAQEVVKHSDRHARQRWLANGADVMAWMSALQVPNPSEIIRQKPDLLGLIPQYHLDPRVEYWKTLGVQRIGHVLAACPQLAFTSLVDMEDVTDLLHREGFADIGALVEEDPCLLLHKSHELGVSLQVLHEDWGLVSADIARHMNVLKVPWNELLNIVSLLHSWKLDPRVDLFLEQKIQVLRVGSSDHLEQNMIRILGLKTLMVTPEDVPSVRWLTVNFQRWVAFPQCDIF